MIPNVVKLVRQHHIGLLVIDEIQNLFRRKTNAANDLKDFIVRIINDLRVPVLMIGTAEASDFLDETFRVTRRTTGLLQPNWGRLAEDGREWIPFTDALWNYRYVLNESPLNSPVPDTDYNLRHLFFDLTQGIPDLAVKLYFLAQRHAINQGSEKVTADVLKHISETSLSQNKRYLTDLRAGRRPTQDFVYEKVFQDELALPECAPKPKKQNQKRPKASPAAHNPTLSLFDFKDNESMYEAGKRNGLIHTDEG
jgi:hypothetical protein